jgi:YegS/Rv2252/BmrU family lipid kinase
VADPICLIVNPSAGGGKSARLAPEMEQALRSEGLTVRRVETRDLDHARALAGEAAASGEMVVTLSGDGLIGVVADALRAHPGAVIGVLPGGRGNDLARVLAIPQDAREACRALATGVPRPVDLGVVGESDSAADGQAFVGIASAGFDSDANRIANEAPSWLGGLVYAYGALRALFSWRPARFEIELQPSGERHTFTGYTVAAANSRAYGGGMYLAPEAMLDDGLLDIVVTEHVGKLRFLANLPKVFKGAHVKLPTVHVFRAQEVRISADRDFTLYADGDPIGELPVRIRALRGAVTIITPRSGGPALSPASRPSPPAEQIHLDGASSTD